MPVCIGLLRVRGLNCNQMFSFNVFFKRKGKNNAQDPAKVFLKHAICVTLAESGEWVMLAEL